MRVLLADDHALFRAGIESLVRAWDVDVVGHASDGHEAVAQARRLHPDLILMDIGMPGCNGIEATRLIKAELPETKIVMVTVSDDDEDVFEAIKCGADGYLLKDMSEQELSSTLEAVAAGKPAMSPALAARIVEEFARAARATDETQAAALTPRESEVLRLVAAGATNREIAAELDVTENTVSFHVKNILAKLHLKNRAQAAAYAVRSGLAEPTDRAQS
jgi:DNA-binding NarL/FixJ family response regulator